MGRCRVSSPVPIRPALFESAAQCERTGPCYPARSLKESAAAAMGIHDVHAHLTHPLLREHSDAVLDRAAKAGLSRIISNGLNPEDNAAVAALARRNQLVLPAFGLYPVDAVLPEMLAMGMEYPREAGAWTGEEAMQWVNKHCDDAVAIGEIGLDGYWVPEELWDRQEQLFRSLVQLAIDRDKPIIIHSRKRERRCLEILEEMGTRRANFHCFGGKVKLARRVAEAGFYLSIPANARRSQSFTRMLETLPRSQLLLETDCPYLAPQRGEDNEPGNVAVTADYAAELWDEDSDAVVRQLEENFFRLFRVEP